MLKEEVLLTMANDSSAATAIQLAPLNYVMLGIYPVEPLACVVDGEAVGPVEGSVSNYPPTKTVHVRVLNPWSVTPIRPVDLTGERNGPIRVINI